MQTPQRGDDKTAALRSDFFHVLGTPIDNSNLDHRLRTLQSNRRERPESMSGERNSALAETQDQEESQ